MLGKSHKLVTGLLWHLHDSSMGLVFVGEGYRWAICCDRDAAPIFTLVAFGGEDRHGSSLDVDFLAGPRASFLERIKAHELALCCNALPAGLVHECFSHVLCCDRDAVRASHFP